ncbi:MAG: amidase [Gemmatimonadaceae bacterium]
MATQNSLEERETTATAPTSDSDRRAFLGEVATALAAIALAPDLAHARSATTSLLGGAPAPNAPEITEHTIAEAEKLSALEFTPKERQQIVSQIGQQINAVIAVRKVPIAPQVQPAIVFDPRIPGVSYPAQSNRVALAPSDAPRLPSDDTDIAFAPTIWQAQWIRSKQLTSARLTNIYLARIERLAPELGCYITVTAERARAKAAAMDKEIAAGKYRGPLHGIPYGLKDVFDTAGIASTWGSPLYKDRVPAEDATIVNMLRNAGAVLLGKTATAELANGTQWFAGIGRNPWNVEETAGGSSTGSGAATAAALCSFSIGTDSAGSILNPADRCGVVGLRATFGRVPVKGGMPLTPSFERIGPLCRRVEDAALVLAAINGPDPTSASSIDMGFNYNAAVDITQLKVGYFPAAFVPATPPAEGRLPNTFVTDAQRQALEAVKSLGVQVVPIELPDLPYSAIRQSLAAETAAVFQDLMLTRATERMLPDSAWPPTWRRISLFSAVDYLRVEMLRRQVMLVFQMIFSDVDALFGPTYGPVNLLWIMSATGHPGLTLRAGFAQSVMRPLGVNGRPPSGQRFRITQNVAFHGRLFEEGKIIALGRALEKKLGIWQERPPIG